MSSFDCSSINLKDKVTDDRRDNVAVNNIEPVTYDNQTFDMVKYWYKRKEQKDIDHMKGIYDIFKSYRINKKYEKVDPNSIMKFTPIMNCLVIYGGAGNMMP